MSGQRKVKRRLDGDGLFRRKRLERKARPSVPRLEARVKFGRCEGRSAPGGVTSYC